MSSCDGECSEFQLMFVWIPSKSFKTKLGMVIDHQKSECDAWKLCCYLHGHGHSEGLYNQNTTVYTILSKLMFFVNKFSMNDDGAS